MTATEHIEAIKAIAELSATEISTEGSFYDDAIRQLTLLLVERAKRSVYTGYTTESGPLNQAGEAFQARVPETPPEAAPPRS
jgi:hypothetical protein